MVRRSFVVVVGSLVLVACGGALNSLKPSRAENIAEAESGCTADYGACQARCLRGDSTFCDVLVLHNVEGASAYVEWQRAHDQKPFAERTGPGVDEIKGRLTEMCQAGVQRACTAVERASTRAPINDSTSGATASHPVPSVDPSKCRGVEGSIAVNDPDACQRACDSGIAAACARLGLSFLAAEDSPEDGAKAAALLRRSCDAEARYGCGSLGLLQVRGYGTPKDTTGGLGNMEKGCKAQDKQACAMLGLTLTDGEHVPKDEKRALDAYLEGCRLQDGDSCTQAATLYLEAPGGIQKDPAMAMQLFQRACSAGSREGCAGVVEAQVGKPKDAATLKAEKVKAEAALPGLFAKCEQQRLAVEGVRVAGIQAARSRNASAAQQAAAKMKDIEPAWSTTLSEIKSAIDAVTLTTDGTRDVPRYAQLIREVKLKCDCGEDPRRPGYCRKR